MSDKEKLLTAELETAKTLLGNTRVIQSEGDRHILTAHIRLLEVLLENEIKTPMPSRNHA